MIALPPDFRDVLLALDHAGAEFVVVGGYAVAFHGHARGTKDIDIFVRPTHENAERVFRALAAFGARVEAFEVTASDFTTYDGVFQMGVPPYRIDILSRVAGVTFDEAVADGAVLEVDGVRVRVIGRAALLASTRAAGREQDLAHLAALSAERGT